jgi:hypothetical protein
MGARINFGQVNDVRCPVAVLTGAAIAFKANGGKFVTGYGGSLALAGAASTGIIGWAELAEFTTATTDVITVNTARDAVYEMPIAAARTEAQLQALVGKTCDIIVTSGIQYANYAASAVDILQIVGYSYYGPDSGQQSVWVKVYQANVTVSGVA